MLVVSDTSPICYLLLIGQIDLLPQLYDQVFIPEIVRDELLAQQSPDEVQRWMSCLPNWMIVHTVTQSPDAELSELDRGEQAAIL